MSDPEPRVSQSQEADAGTQGKAEDSRAWRSLMRIADRVFRVLMVLGGIASAALGFLLSFMQLGSSDLTFLGMVSLVAVSMFGILTIPSNGGGRWLGSVVLSGGVALASLALASATSGWINHYLRLVVLEYLLPLAGMTWLCATGQFATRPSTRSAQPIKCSDVSK